MTTAHVVWGRLGDEYSRWCRIVESHTVVHPKSIVCFSSPSLQSFCHSSLGARVLLIAHALGFPLPRPS
jgi:hypothetical protein